ncbi:hypothetical protein J437_LFUL017513 [Ladona fulva]|uniref:CHK kinase-like domain-containing protein n=1 Tax=Ladona fulva TaxID=123851 RepID=A0A8K0P8T7_LADFU|nr:hypothetical protein J437_LFUL017513 [Ladona fulva]
MHGRGGRECLIQRGTRSAANLQSSPLRSPTMPAEIKPPSPEDVVAGQVPIWMDACFFQKALREGGDDPKIRVVECDVEEALGKGENYVSIVYRALVKDGNGKEYHLIIKCLPSNEARKMSNQGKFFRKEIDMYGVVFPAYEKLQPKKDSLPWPKHFFSFLDGECDYLVMEDLKRSGFVMRERHRGLDKNHAEVALSAMAKHHANSFMMKILDPEKFKKCVELFPESIFNSECSDIMETFIKTALETTAENVREWGGQRYQQIAAKIEKMQSTAFKDVIELLEPVEPGAVITHGDFWVNNMLFKYSNAKEAETGSAKPVDIKLLDFQIARYSSPVTDLVYFMVSSITGKTRKEHWDDLLESAYLKTFWDTMEYFGLKDQVPKGIFTMEWLKSECRRNILFTFMSSITVTPAVLAEAEEAPDMDKLTEEELTGEAPNPFVDLYKGKVFVARFKELVDLFEEEGLFF